MTTRHLMTPDGTIILPGAMLHAVKGVHAGSHWRLDKIIHNGVTHVLRCTRYMRRLGRVVMDLHPSVFGMDVVEMTRWFQITRHDLVRAWRKIDDGLIMGLLALVPLAIFEAFHGSEIVAHVLANIAGRGGK